LRNPRVSRVTPNNQFQLSVNSRLRRLSPPAELGRRASQRTVEIAMKSLLLTLLAAVVLVAGGCARITPIKSLALPPVTAIEGTITQIDESGFTLADSSGSIFVRARLPGGKKLDVALDERVKVYGNLQGGPDKMFDGYVIRKPTGEQIIISNPTPHFGFIIQSSFQ
jgi:hypothetical protein